MVFPTYSTQVVVEGHDRVRHFHAQEDVTQGQVVKLDTDNAGRSVEPSDGDGEKAYGVALYDQSSGGQVAVAGPGAVVRAVSSTGSISSGDWVATHGSSGDPGTLDSGASGEYYFGMALEDDTGSNTEASVIVHVHPAINGAP
jgi:hypothetical protein